MSGRAIRAVAYARFSSRSQNEISIEAQLEADRRYIDERGWTFVGEYADEAKTGTNDNREDFQRMLEDARGDKYDIAVVWNTNRLNRNMLNAFALLSELFRYGKDFRSVNQEDLNDPDNPMRLLMYAVHAWSDEDYSRGLSVDIRRGKRKLAEAGHPDGQVHFGWDIAGARIDESGRYWPGDRYELNGREAAAVREMMRLRASGHCWTSIEAILWDAGHRDKRGRRIGWRTIARVVKSERPKGVYVYMGERIEGGMPRIVSDEEWDAAQRPRRMVAGRCKRHRKHVRVRAEMEFGDLVAVEVARVTKSHHYVWACECRACGGTKVEWAQRLTSGKATHCGCKSTGQPHGADGKFVSPRQ